MLPLKNKLISIQNGKQRKRSSIVYNYKFQWNSFFEGHRHENVKKGNDLLCICTKTKFRTLLFWHLIYIWVHSNSPKRINLYEFLALSRFYIACRWRIVRMYTAYTHECVYKCLHHVLLSLALAVCVCAQLKTRWIRVVFYAFFQCWKLCRRS